MQVTKVYASPTENRYRGVNRAGIPVSFVSQSVNGGWVVFEAINRIPIAVGATERVALDRTGIIDNVSQLNASNTLYETSNF